MRINKNTWHARFYDKVNGNEDVTVNTYFWTVLLLIPLNPYIFLDTIRNIG